MNEHFALFARTAHSFRLPTVDERVGLGDPTNFALRTQTSQDIEGGIRSKFGPVTVQSSLYRMWLRDEIFFSPAKFINTNLDPTLRYGWENIASWRVSDTLRLKAGLAYTRSVFREGPFAGADVPLVSRWTGSAGVSYDIYKQYLVFDAGVRFVGTKRMDNDAANLQTKIPSHALVDVRFGGTYEKLTWSLAAQNLFDRRYFDYAIASTFSPGAYNAYPLPGRTFLAKAGTTW